MKCPTCEGVDLLITERRGIEIDYCPKCRGVWLDRGELDKIIAGADQQLDQPPPVYTPRQPEPAPRDYDPARYASREKYEVDDDDRRYYERNGNGDYRQYPYRKKKESFWGELFDFD